MKKKKLETILIFCYIVIILLIVISIVCWRKSIDDRELLVNKTTTVKELEDKNIEFGKQYSELESKNKELENKNIELESELESTKLVIEGINTELDWINELSNCPMCHKKDIELHQVMNFYFAKCNICGLRTDYFSSQDELIEYWNGAEKNE